MSLNKNEFEYMRLYAQKCDHRNMAPMASFDLASDLRAHKGRGGRMFEKRKQRSDKYVFDDSHDPNLEPEQGSFQRPEHFAPQPAIWKPPSQTSGHMEMMDRMNQNNHDARDNAGPADDDHLSDAERLQKLYRVLRYVPPEDAAQKKRPMKTPKANLRSKSHLSLLSGRDFNRNAKGWCAGEGEVQETAISTPSSEQIPELLTPGMDNNYYYPAADLSPGSQDPYMYHKDKPRPKSWHSVRMEDFALQEDEFLIGDYNPRPKAWEPQYDDVDYPRGLCPFGDYNPRPKAWQSNEAEDILRNEVQYGDYNPRPKAWRAKHRKRKDQQSYGDYNPRPKAWQSSERGHYQSQVKEPASEIKFGDYNPRPKAWKSPERSTRRKVRYGDYNPRPKAWRSAPEDDSSSTSSTYSSAESSDDDYSYGSSLYLPGYIPACDV